LFHESSSTQICEIVLKKEGTEIYSRIVTNLAGSTQTKVPLFWRVNPGEGYQLICRNIGTALKRSTVVYPLKVTNLLSMESAVSSAGDYPYLFNWVIAKYSGCPSRKIEVEAKILNGQTPSTPVIQTQSDSLLCPIQAPFYEWMINGQVQSSATSAKIRGLLNSTYQVRYKLDSCWSEWSEPFVVTSTTSSQEFEISSQKFYPNPVSNMLYWQGNENLQEISIYSSEGKLILHKPVCGKEILSLSNLSDGFYLLKWKSQNRQGVERVAVQH
jgi:hypothetical protein